MTAATERRVAVASGVAVRALPGETTSGDVARVFPCRRGILAVLVDGLGHGPRAAAASDALVDVVGHHVDRSIDELFLLAHKALVKTRGAVAAIARFDEIDAKVELAALGNVAMVLVPLQGHTSHRGATPGIVGGAYRTVRPETLSFGLGDMLIFHSDGVRARLDLAPVRALSPTAAALEVVRRGGKPGDDASCIVARGVAPVAGQSVTAPIAAPRDGGGAMSFSIRRLEDAMTIANETRTFGERHGLPLRARWEASIAAAELSTNVAKFAGEGTLTLRRAAAPFVGIEIEVVDRGAGIADLAAAERDGFSEGAPLGPDRARRAGQGLGLGLGTVRRMMDHVRIDSIPGQGTRVVARKHA